MTPVTSHTRRRSLLPHAAVLALLAAGVLWPAAAATNIPPPIEWKSSGATVVGAAQRVQPPTALAGDSHVVVQLAAVADDEERTALAGDGLTLLTYLGSNAYFARREDRAGAPQTNPAGTLIGQWEIDPRWKTDPQLADGAVPWYVWVPAAEMAAATGSAVADPVVALYVVFHPDVTPAVSFATVQAHHGLVRDTLPSINAALVWIPYDEIAALVADDNVQWIEPPLPALDPTNDSNRALTQADDVNDPPYGLDGSGVNVLVYDGGVALASHPDFGGRLTARDDAPLHYHATHVAGTIGGDGSQSLAGGGTDRQWRGMAPGVVIQSYGFQASSTQYRLFNNAGDLERDYDEAINVFGAQLANNSIGVNAAANGYPCTLEGAYGVTDALIDAIVRGSLGQPMRVVWAAGNERGSGRCGTTYRTTAPPSNAKNHISVGAVYSDTDQVTSFSGWGPSIDGRLKPDITAPGCELGGDRGVTSTTSSGGEYQTLCGTSMAAPTVTGLSALLLQEWQRLFPDRPLPRNAMLKALLAHNAVDRGNPGPDFQYGYGSVRIGDTIDFMRGGGLREDSLSQGEVVTLLTYVAPGTEALKVTLAWDDIPGVVNVVPELVNDLDLALTDPSGQTTHLPWTLDPANPAALARRDRADHLNNLEQVVA